MYDFYAIEYSSLDRVFMSCSNKRIPYLDDDDSNPDT